MKLPVFSKKVILLISLCVAVLIAIVTAVIVLKATPKKENQNSPQPQAEETEAVKAGKILSHNSCEGTGSVTLTHLPMKEQDFAFLIPYGLVVGAHVTPIDHQYFSPTVFNSPRDTYEVRAMADGVIVDIQRRSGGSLPGASSSSEEYRIVFMHTCTFFTYYDLVTSLAPKVKAEFERVQSGVSTEGLKYKVKAGELGGYIGGRTLDFAVWDTEKPLTGFVNPESYESELWKIYTADPYDYYSDELKEILTKRNLRTAKPIAGKIDYDIDGKLIGNWFEEGTNGYEGKERSKYYAGHLSIAPDHLDPNGIIVSLGDFGGEPKQFAVPAGSPDPSQVSTESGLVKYDLVDFVYKTGDGKFWDRNSLSRGLTLEPSGEGHGCVLFLLVESRKLRVESFPGVKCTSVSGFTAKAKYYVR